MCFENCAVLRSKKPHNAFVGDTLVRLVIVQVMSTVACARCTG